MAEVRILSHMNKDHRVSIEDYLVVYGGVKLGPKLKNIKMTHIELSHMTVSFDHDDLEFPVEKLIPFEPPLGDLKEARVKLVEMARFAADKRGHSPYQIAEFRALTWGNWALVLLIYLPFISYLFPEVLHNSTVSPLVPLDKVDWVLSNALNITYLTLFLHALECWFLVRPRMNFYRVPVDNQLEWYISGLIEGYPSVKRFNKVVEERVH